LVETHRDGGGIVGGNSRRIRKCDTAKKREGVGGETHSVGGGIVGGVSRRIRKCRKHRVTRTISEIFIRQLFFLLNCGAVSCSVLQCE